MQELSAQQYIKDHRPAAWSRSTVADGKWMQDKTFTPLNNNDEQLASFIDDLVKGLNIEEKTRADAVEATLNAAKSYTDTASAYVFGHVNDASAYLNSRIDVASSSFSSYYSEMNDWASDINGWRTDINAWQSNVNKWRNETVNPKLNELESAIAGIEGASDVYDIVATSAALNNYTGRLTPKAVIKVLSAGPNNDQQVYYRWNHNKTAAGSWTIADFDYIGAVQAYYDKGYIDDNYYKKTEVDNYLEGKVDANNEQDFTSAQQLRARTNIGAIGNTEIQQLLDEIDELKNKGLVVVGTQLRFE